MKARLCSVMLWMLTRSRYITHRTNTLSLAEVY